MSIVEEKDTLGISVFVSQHNFCYSPLLGDWSIDFAHGVAKYQMALIMG